MWQPKITREQFEKQYAEKSKISLEDLKKLERPYPCVCDYENCHGWQMLSQESALTILKFEKTSLSIYNEFKKQYEEYYGKYDDNFDYNELYNVTITGGLKIEEDKEKDKKIIRDYIDHNSK